MEPPSETHGVERDELVRRLSEDTDARARVVTPSHAPGQGLFGSTLRAHTVVGQERVDLDAEARRYTRHQHDDRDQQDEHELDGAGSVGLFQGALDNTVRAQPVAAQAAASTRPPPPPVGGRVAPEAWRDEVRRMVERAPTKGPGPSAPSGPSATSSQQPGALGGPSAPGGAGGPGIPGSFKPSLRLKLDADVVDEAAYRAPKSALPKVMVWLVILGLIGGGLVLFADPKGIAALLKRFNAPPPTLTAQDPQPPAAAAASAPTVAPGTQQPPAAAPSAPTTPTQPAAAGPAANAQPAAAPAQPSAAAPQVTQPTTPPPAAAQPKTEAPKAAEPKVAEPAAKPAAPVAKPAAPKPARPVRPQQPVVKVRPIESAPSAPAASPTETAPPTPDHPDIPYVPMPGDPPAPDEPR